MASSFRFDPNLCTGCAACRLGCTIENELPYSRSWRRIETFNPSRLPEIPLYHLSLACNHCAEPACMHACPALAYRRDASTGAVLLDPEKCIGCKYCSWACPYDAPVFDPQDGVMTKCTFCNERLGRGDEPACVALCPTGALGFSDLDSFETTQPLAGFPRTDLGPRIRIEPLRRVCHEPEDEGSPPGPVPPELPATPAPAISMRTEWSLWGFTGLLAALVALVATAATTSLRIPPLAFVGAAAVTMGLASAHLGRKLRAWRAVLNVRRSWLSREIVSVGTFVGAAVLYTGLFPDDGRIGIVTTMLGFLALFCADRVYSVLGRFRTVHLHSASLLWTGFFLTGIFSHDAWVAGLFGTAKLVLYAMRRRRRPFTIDPRQAAIGSLRVLGGFAAPLLLWNTTSGLLWSVAIASAMIGELIDRGEFYGGLDRTSPSRSMALALREAVARWSAPAPGPDPWIPRT